MWGFFLVTTAFVLVLTGLLNIMFREDDPPWVHCEHCDNIRYKDGVWEDTCQGHPDKEDRYAGYETSNEKLRKR